MTTLADGPLDVPAEPDLALLPHRQEVGAQGSSQHLVPRGLEDTVGRLVKEVHPDGSLGVLPLALGHHFILCNHIFRSRTVLRVLPLAISHHFCTLQLHDHPKNYPRAS